MQVDSDKQHEFLNPLRTTLIQFKITPAAAADPNVMGHF